MHLPVKETLPEQKQKPLSVIEISKKGRQKLRSRQYAEARKLFSAGLEQEPENPYLLSGMGDVCRETGDFAAAERCYRSLLGSDRNNLFALRGLGDVCKKLNRHQEAIELWDRYLDLRPQDRFVMCRVADSCKVMTQFERAEQVYRQILQISAADRFALTGMADLQHRQGKDETAIETYKKVLRFDENDLHILTIIGKLCWRISDFERAKRYFIRALKVAPDNPYALYGLGNCYRWKQQYAQAIDLWQKILISSDGTQALHTRMGDAYFHLGQLDEAESSYQKSLEFGEDPFALAGLICLAGERNDWQGAAANFWLLLAASGDKLNRIEMLIGRFVRSGQQQSMLKLFRYLLLVGGEDKVVLTELEKQLERLT